MIGVAGAGYELMVTRSNQCDRAECSDQMIERRSDNLVAPLSCGYDGLVRLMRIGVDRCRLGELGAIAGRIPSIVGIGSMVLEVLHGAFVLFGDFTGIKGSKIPAAASSRIELARVKPVFARVELANHGLAPTRGCGASTKLCKLCANESQLAVVPIATHSAC